MEKGDKPKSKDKKAKKAPKQKQKQSQVQKQSVKVVIGETKAKRKYVRKAKVVKPTTNIVRGQTVVSYLGGESDLNQVITGPNSARQQTQQAPPPPPRNDKPPQQPPVLLSTQAPATLDTELNATSEFLPIARTPVLIEEKKKKAVAKKKKPIVVQIGEGIGDFIKKNLLDQPADLITQEASRPIEKPRPPLTIKPEPYPVVPSKRRKPIQKEKEPSFIVSGGGSSKPVADIPIQSKYAVEQAMIAEIEQMGMEDPLKTEQKKPVEELVVKEKKSRKKKILPVVIEEPAEVVSMQDPAPLTREELNQSLRGMIVADTIDDIISTIETPIFSTNEDFRTISQNVDVENVPSSQLDFGNEDITQFNVEGFVPVGTTEGMEEAVTKKGRPRKYDDPEIAKQVKLEQTRESNKRLAEEKKNAKKWEGLVKKLQTQREYEEFSSLEQATDSLRTTTEMIRERRREEEENPYSYEKLNPNAPRIYVAEEIPTELPAGTIMYEIGKRKADQRNREAYDSDFISGDFSQQIGDLVSSNNFGGVKSMIGDDIGYSDETPVPTTAKYSVDAEDSNLPFLGIGDIEFV